MLVNGVWKENWQPVKQQDKDSSDYRVVHWDQQQYTLIPSQAKIL